VIDSVSEGQTRASERLRTLRLRVAVEFQKSLLSQ
jgi:hypothetical protein